VIYFGWGRLFSQSDCTQKLGLWAAASGITRDSIAGPAVDGVDLAGDATLFVVIVGEDGIWHEARLESVRDLVQDQSISAAILWVEGVPEVRRQQGILRVENRVLNLRISLAQLALLDDVPLEVPDSLPLVSLEDDFGDEVVDPAHADERLYIFLGRELLAGPDQLSVALQAPLVALAQLFQAAAHTLCRFHVQVPEVAKLVLLAVFDAPFELGLVCEPIVDVEVDVHSGVACGVGVLFVVKSPHETCVEEERKIAVESATYQEVERAENATETRQ